MIAKHGQKYKKNGKQEYYGNGAYQYYTNDVHGTHFLHTKFSARFTMVYVLKNCFGACLHHSKYSVHVMLNYTVSGQLAYAYW